MPQNFVLTLQTLARYTDIEYQEQVQNDIKKVLDSGVSSYADLLRRVQDLSVAVDIRVNMAWLIGIWGNKRGVSALLNVLKDASPPIRRQAAISLGQLGSKKAVDALSACFVEDKDIEVRKCAGYALGQIGDKRTATLLSARLLEVSEAPQVRGQAAEALGMLNSPQQAIPALKMALRDNEVEVRFWTVFALGEIGTIEVIPELETVDATDEGFLEQWGFVKDEAKQAIEAIQQRLV